MNVIQMIPRELKKENRPIKLVGIVLDCSSSMRGFENHVIECVNSFLSELKADAHSSYYVCAFGFDSQKRVMIPLTNVSKIDAFRKYTTQGMTRLWATVQEVLEYLQKCASVMKEDLEIDASIVLQVLTDGEDNQSNRDESNLYPECLKNKVLEMQQHATGFHVYGFGNDATKIAQQMGFPSANAKSVQKNREGMNDITRQMSSSTISCNIEK